MAIITSKIFNEGKIEMNDKRKVNVLLTEHLISSECTMKGLKVYYLIKLFDDTYEVKVEAEAVRGAANYKFSMITDYEFEDSTHVKCNKIAGPFKSMKEYHVERLEEIKLFVITDKTGDCGDYFKAIRKAVAMYFGREEEKIKILNDRFVGKDSFKSVKTLSHYVDLMSESTHVLSLAGSINNMARMLDEIRLMYNLNQIGKYQLVEYLRNDNDYAKTLSAIDPKFDSISCCYPNPNLNPYKAFGSGELPMYDPTLGVETGLNF